MCRVTLTLLSLCLIIEYSVRRNYCSLGKLSFFFLNDHILNQKTIGKNIYITTGATKTIINTKFTDFVVVVAFFMAL